MTTKTKEELVEDMWQMFFRLMFVEEQWFCLGRSNLVKYMNEHKKECEEKPELYMERMKRAFVQAYEAYKYVELYREKAGDWKWW